MQLTRHARPKFMILMKEDDAQIYCCIIRHCIDVSSNQEILIVKAFENIPPSPCAHIKTSRTTGSFVGIANSFFLENRNISNWIRTRAKCISCQNWNPETKMMPSGREHGFRKILFSLNFLTFTLFFRASPKMAKRWTKIVK